MLPAILSSGVQTYETLILTQGLSLQKGRVHEVIGYARTGFVSVVTGMETGPVIWIGRERAVGALHPMGLKDFINPGRILTVQCLSRKEVLWAAETALRTREASAVVIELSMGPNLQESRRLQLAAEEGGGLGLVLVETRAQTSSVQTRWNCTSCKTKNLGETPCWIWELIKNKAGPTGTWQVQWRGRDHAPDYVHLVSATAA